MGKAEGIDSPKHSDSQCRHKQSLYQGKKERGNHVFAASGFFVKFSRRLDAKEQIG
jgi:hypothetical protein